MDAATTAPSTKLSATRVAVIARIEAFCLAHALSERAFGRRAVEDHKFVPRLRAGRGVTLTVIERAERFMDATGAPGAQAADEAAA